MPYVPVPKDLNKIRTKIAFNLTKRQLICFAGAAVVGIPTYLLTRGTTGNDVAVLLMICLMLPFFFFAMYEKNGQPFEKVVRNVIRHRFIMPRTRPYKTNNFYAALERQAKLDKEAQQIAHKDHAAKTAGKTARGGAAGPQGS